MQKKIMDRPWLIFLYSCIMISLSALQNGRRALTAGILAGALLLAGVFFLPGCNSTPSARQPALEPADTATAPEDGSQIPLPRETLRLPDSTWVYLLKGERPDPGTRFGYTRTVTADGDLYFDIPARSMPFKIHTRLLVLTAIGKAGFRLIALRKEEGEEVQVLYGNIIAKKAYPSQFPEADTLRDNDLLMINRSIDLMEKEPHNDFSALRAWKERVGVPARRDSL